MKPRAFSRSRLATATSVAAGALCIALQFLRAIVAVPRIPQRQISAGIASVPQLGKALAKLGPGVPDSQHAAACCQFSMKPGQLFQAGPADASDVAEIENERSAVGLLDQAEQDLPYFLDERPE